MRLIYPVQSVQWLKSLGHVTWKAKQFTKDGNEMRYETNVLMRLSSCVPSARRPLRPDLQAVHVGAGLAGGRPELHEGAAVSFRAHGDTLTRVWCVSL